MNFKAPRVSVCVCVEVNRPERREVQQANQLLERLNKPPVTLLHYKCIHSPSFHTIMHFTEGLLL